MRASAAMLCSTLLILAPAPSGAAAPEPHSAAAYAAQMKIPVVHYRTENIAGTDIFISPMNGNNSNRRITLSPPL